MQNMHALVQGVDLNLLATLGVLVSEGNVTRAAVKLGLSQSAMSHRLARLRELFDDPLLVATGDGMVPTARALQLAEPLARGLLEFEAALRSEAEFDPLTSTRQFTAACVDFGDFLVLPALLAQIRERAPNIVLSLVRTPPGLADLLERGVIDVAITGGGPHLTGAGLLQRSVINGSFASAVRADHPGVGERLDLTTFLRLPHLLISPSGEGPGIVDGALARLGKQRHVAARVASFAAAPFVAARSDLVLTAPLAVLEEAAQLVPLRIFEPPLSLPRDDALMVWHERWQQDPGHRWLREINVEVMAKLSTPVPERPFEPGEERGAARPRDLISTPKPKPKSKPKRRG